MHQGVTKGRKTLWHKNLKKLIGGEVYYRIRILDYRLGFAYEAEKIILIRFLHRKEIYNYFP
jgi:mRNA interferase RelE/StbE